MVDDATEKAFNRAILAFVGLACFQLLLAFVLGRQELPAAILFVGGLHNMMEGPLLGTLQKARRIETDHQPSFWNCYGGRLGPAWTAGLALVAGAVISWLELTGRHHHGYLAALVAASVEVVDFIVNRRFARLLHGTHDHHQHGADDEMAHAGERHLKGDAGFALCGILAYTALALRGPWWLDPLGAGLGIGCIFYYNLEPIRLSVAGTWNHRGHRKRHRLGQI